MTYNEIDITSPYSEELLGQVQAKLDDLTKPPGSLGRLEEFTKLFCCCQGSADAELKKMHIYTFAADHGITQEKITPFPAEVTPQMVLNMLSGGAAVSVMCNNAGIGFNVVDTGVNYDFGAHPLLLQCKTVNGTRNFAREPAMSQEECDAALNAGLNLAKGTTADLIGVGEMGIGNTSAASALYSMLLGLDPEETVGAGTGSAGELLLRKIEAVRKGVNLHYQDWDETAIDALRCVGGLEIAGMTGMILGCANRGIPIVVDGFIASSAALVAMKMQSDIRDFLVFSHISNEKFHRNFFKNEGLHPVLDLDMRLGEGTGAVLAMQIVQQAMNCYHQMATFSSAGVSR